MQTRAEASVEPDEARPPISGVVAAATLGYIVVASLAWYALRDRGLVGQRSVPLVYLGGVVTFYVALWIARGVPFWRLGRETIVVTVSTLAFLTLFWFFGRRGNYSTWFGADPPWGGLRGLIPFFFFVGSSVLMRVVMPLLTGRLVLRRPASAYGWRLRSLELWWVYLALFLAVLPFVYHASSLPSFLAKYPWCKQGVEDGRMQLGVLAVYASASFVFYSSGEAFWRGWLLFGTERELGDTALFLMLVPYVISHFGKPLPETLGAVLSGLILGYLALRHRSFWLGAVTHWGVAMSMDLLALWRKGVELVV